MIIYLCIFLSFFFKFSLYHLWDFLFTFFFFPFNLGSSFDLITFHTALTHTHTFFAFFFTSFFFISFFAPRISLAFFLLDIMLLIFRCVLVFREKLLLFMHLIFNHFSLFILNLLIFFVSINFHFFVFSYFNIIKIIHRNPFMGVSSLLNPYWIYNPCNKDNNSLCLVNLLILLLNVWLELLKFSQSKRLEFSFLVFLFCLLLFSYIFLQLFFSLLSFTVYCSLIELYYFTLRRKIFFFHFVVRIFQSLKITLSRHRWFFFDKKMCEVGFRK